MTTSELLDQEKFKLSEIEREIASHSEEGKGLDVYAQQLQSQLKMLNEETGPAWRAKAVELHDAAQQAKGAIATLERLAENAQTASA
jgi:siroheme synthase (precorrin-2 oxidase/ferrochelatase)